MALLALLRQSNGIVPSAPRVALAASLGRVAPTRTTALAATAAQVPTFVTDHRASRGGARVMVSNVKEVLPKFRSEFRRPRRIKDRGRAVVSCWHVNCAPAAACCVACDCRARVAALVRVVSFGCVWRRGPSNIAAA